MLAARKTTDEAALRDVLSGNRDTFGLLVDRYLPMVHACAYAYTRNHADAEDVAQDAFLKAFQSLDTLRERNKFGAWLISIARNLALRLREKRARELPLGKGEVEAGAAPAPDMAQRELRQLLHRQMDELDDAHREILLLYYFSGQKLAEIAQVLGITTHAAKKRLQRARQE
ncbi:MAG TPA: sigma-70 family RNA polymerase sigma factor, partial [Candidatus Hydrogenedentes bacterium]|nr:sigma-70 family RNA polymerase sigma factor [Candidatus Hydrogenedentota bacterium]